MNSNTIILITAVISVACLAANAAYEQIGKPRTWRLSHPTPSYKTAAKTDLLGNFRANIELEVIDVDHETGMWYVKYDRANADDVFAYIEIPDLSKHYQSSFSVVDSIIAEFPILQKMLEADNPWSVPLSESTEGVENQIWGMQPLRIRQQMENSIPSITFEIWNKGEAFQSEVNPSQANTIIIQRLERLQRFFRLEKYKLNRPMTELSAIKQRASTYYLPNDIIATLSYASREYLNLRFESYNGALAVSAPPRNPYDIAERMKQKRYSHAGHIYIAGIPMINQGKKGYCAPATLARITQFLGYSANQYQFADITETESQYFETDYGGALDENIISGTRRAFSGTPYRLKHIGTRKDLRYSAIQEAIDSAMPIIWMIPGHMRLIIGYHPETREIVYSDSWGEGHEFKTMSWEEYLKYNQQMWMLEPRNQ